MSFISWNEKKSFTDFIDMMDLLKKIAPLSRTLANKDTDTALKIVQGFLPGSLIDGTPTGKSVWSWIIPQRWELERATIKANGIILVDAEWSPLHVINYSQSFEGTVTHQELLKHIKTNPERPKAIPFSFSFYEPEWGFSIPHDWLVRFKAKKYEVEIKTRFETGLLNTLSLFIPGDNEQTFVICSNICHPLQVNDSLTGVAVAVDIANRLLAQKNRKYSYLILVVPETIGSISYFAKETDKIKHSIGGFFSEMLGTDGPIVGQRTRLGSSYWDYLLEENLKNSNLPFKIVNFLKSASNDEKVMDSPGVDIPTFSITRAPYPEYHTSDDNIDLINLKRLREGRDILQRIIDLAEYDYIPVLNQPGPIFLSGYDLYPNWRNDPSLLPIWNSFIDVMYCIDGIHSVVQLSKKHNIPIDHFFYWTDEFAKKGLLSKKVFILRK